MKMMKLGKCAIATLAMGTLAVVLFGCQKQEGPAERAGKSVDTAVEKAGQKIEKAGSSIQDAAKGNQK